MKKFICFLSALIILTTVFSVSTFAVSTEIIDQADIEMIVNADGTVNVTEKWTVTYVNASDVFYRNIDIYSSSNGMTLMQKYDEITDVAVKIDGKSASDKGAGINIFSFGMAEDGLSYEIAVNCPSAQVTREYEISYNVTGAVKKSGGNAVFAFMVLGEKFAYTSNNVTVTVDFPDEVTDISTTAEYDAVIDDNWITFTSKHVFDKFAVDASSDISAFDKNALATYSAAKENVNKFASAITSVLPWIAVVLAAFVIIVILLFPDRIARSKHEKNVKAIAKADEENIGSTLPGSISACCAYKMLMPVSRISPKKSAKKVPAVFAMAVLECMENRYIVADGNDLIVGTPSKDAPAYIMSTLNFLKTFCEKKGNKYVLDKSFAEKVNAECMSRYDVIVNYLASFYSLIPSAGAGFFRKENNIDIYEKSFAVKLRASKEKHKPGFAECAEKVLSSEKTSSVRVFSMLFGTTSPDKLFAKGRNDAISALCEAFTAMYNVYVKSK